MTTKAWNLIVFILALGVGLSGCRAGGLPRPSATPGLSATLTRTQTKIFSTQTPSQTPVPRPSSTPTLPQQPTTTSTETSALPPQQTSTPTTTITPPKTINPQATLTRQALDAAYALTVTQIARFPVTCENNNHVYLQSPDGSWLAYQCGGHSHGLEVVNKGGKRWDLQYTDYLAEDVVRGGAPLGNLYPIHWTGDGKYLYFITRFNISGGGPCFYGFNTVGLYRLSLDDGTVTATLKDISSSGAFYDFAFSPDGRRFAYADPFTIVDIRTGDEFTIETGGDGIGDLTWSPDGAYLAYSTCYATQDYSATAKSTINIFSIATHRSRTILEVNQDLLRIIFGNRGQVLIISTSNDQTGTFDDEAFYYDWASGQLSTPTPAP